MISSIEILGFVAAILTTVAFLPQVYKTWATKNADDLSSSMLVIFVSGLLCWAAYGFLIDSMPVIIANVLTVILGVSLIFFKFKYKK